MNVLIIEDSLPFAKSVIARLSLGLTMPHSIEHVDHVRAAVSYLQRNTVDLVILDMHLPDANEMDAFQAVYGASPDTPIVILSSDDTEALAMEAVRRGAQDYLIKGCDNNHQLMWSIRFAIERKKRLRAEGELQAARLIQESFLPEHAPLIDGFDVHGAMFPAIETAGDYFDFIQPMTAIGSDVCGIAVGDVSGHGVGPAMMMAETCGCLHSFALLESNVAELMRLTNCVLSQNRNEHFVTLILGYLDDASKRFRYASAGHQAWHLSTDGLATVLPATGTVLGVFKEDSWEVAESPPLMPGDLLVIPTDGVSEAMSPMGETFGDERLFEFIHQHRSCPASEIVDQLYETLIDFTGARPQQDDMTVVLVKFEE
ncbi:MAG: SpoIIE family protein phosphatase [Planctomycetota bacterium]